MNKNFLASYRLRRQRRRRKRLVRIIWLIAALTVGVYFLFNQFSKNSQSSVKGTSLNSTNKTQEINSLKSAVWNTLKDAKGTYGIVVKNLKTGEEFRMNENKIFDAGSLYKLWIMAAAFNKIQEGVWQEGESITADVAKLNKKFSIDPDLAEQKEGTIVFTTGSALRQMITISHNYAALVLTEKLKLSAVKSYLEKNGFNHSVVGVDGSNPVTTPDDIALFFEKLYKEELANEEFTGKMLDLLKMQQLNKKLPKYLPQGTVIAHKTGEIGWFSHDAGIAYLPDKEYIIVVLSESNSPAEAEERIALISKAVYDYFLR